MKSKVPAAAHRLGVLRNQHFVGAERPGVVALAGRGGDHGDMGAERMGELDAHMTQPAEPGDADPLARPDPIFLERRIGRDAGRVRGAADVEAVGQFQDEFPRTTT